MATLDIGSAIIATPSTGESPGELGRVYGPGRLRGLDVAYVRYERSRSAEAGHRPWLDTVPLGDVVLRYA